MPVHYGDVLAVLKTLPDESVHCCVTSPPYWGLRDYRVDGQIGLEKTPQEYLEKMTAVFREVRRVLRADGTAWVNMGDGMAGSVYASLRKQGVMVNMRRDGYKAKDELGMPWMLSESLRRDGWYRRKGIIWSKTSCLPESVQDRPTNSHEYIFLLSKSARYFYDADAIREGLAESSIPRLAQNIENQAGTLRANGGAKTNGPLKAVGDPSIGRNKRSVWTMNTQPYSGAHFATFPEELPRTCILAGTSPKACPVCGKPWKRDVRAEGGTIGKGWTEHAADLSDGMSQVHDRVGSADHGNGKYRRIDRGFIPGCTCDGNDGTGRCVVLDPFLGSGTTAQVAVGLGRDYVGIELNRDYAPLIRQRLALFYDEAA